MAGKLITLPFRVWLKSARLLRRVAGEAAGRAISLAGQTIGASSPDRSGAPEPAQAVAEPPLEPSPAPAPPPPAQPESADISEEPAAIPEEPAAIPQAEPPYTAEAEPPYTAEAEPAYTSETEPAYTAEAEPAYVSEEPAHVSEEPELVREEAEPGAEDGAGAAVTVLEPWRGYAQMNAREVIARARQANPAELAAVRLYEARHRSRQTVLAAVDRQLKLGNGGGPA